MKLRIGIGFDLHRLEPNHPLVLGGIRVPHEKGLVGHTDGDVLLHAVIDALLGACGMGNIGEKFPDTDPRYKGISSRLLLRDTVEMIKHAGYRIGNIDSNILAERPKLLPHFPKMQASIAEILRIPAEDVQVKAKTMERLGAIGREEAIAAQAVALVVVED